jgi:hypothetical protein
VDKNHSTRSAMQVIVDLVDADNEYTDMQRQGKEEDVKTVCKVLAVFAVLAALVIYLTS